MTLVVTIRDDPHGFDVDVDFADALARVQSDAYRLKRNSLEGKRDKIEFITKFVIPLSNGESMNKRPRSTFSNSTLPL